MNWIEVITNLRMNAVTQEHIADRHRKNGDHLDEQRCYIQSGLLDFLACALEAGLKENKPKRGKSKP